MPDRLDAERDGVEAIDEGARERGRAQPGAVFAHQEGQEAEDEVTAAGQLAQRPHRRVRLRKAERAQCGSRSEDRPEADGDAAGRDAEDG
jgi:hypothetical protein